MTGIYSSPWTACAKPAASQRPVFHSCRTARPPHGSKKHTHISAGGGNTAFSASTSCNFALLDSTASTGQKPDVSLFENMQRYASVQASKTCRGMHLYKHLYKQMYMCMLTQNTTCICENIDICLYQCKSMCVVCMKMFCVNFYMGVGPVFRVPERGLSPHLRATVRAPDFIGVARIFDDLNVARANVD